MYCQEPRSRQDLTSPRYCQFNSRKSSHRLVVLPGQQEEPRGVPRAGRRSPEVYPEVTRGVPRCYPQVLPRGVPGCYPRAERYTGVTHGQGEVPRCYPRVLPRGVSRCTQVLPRGVPRCTQVYPGVTQQKVKKRSKPSLSSLKPWCRDGGIYPPDHSADR